MKALLLTNEYPPYVYGGAGVHVEYLTRELARLIDVEVRCFGDQDVREGRLRVKGYGVPKELAASTPPKLRSPVEMLQRSVNWVADPVDADVVHCHTWYAHAGGLLSRLLYGTPLVITTHSLEPLRPWKREQLGRGYDFSSWVEKTALETADAIIAVSEETREDILMHFSVDPGRVSVIPNGIDVEQYQYTGEADALDKAGIPRGLPYVLFVGRITRQKGIIHLVRAIRHLAPGLGVVLLAGQPDTPEIGEEMKRGVAEIQKSRDHVYWIPEMVSKRDAIQFYSHARVFCCPSIYEPFGIINLEAMACGAPVVASAVGGIKEVVVPGETGLLVSFKQQSEAPFEAVDPEGFARDLASGINRIVADQALRDRMGSAGRRRVEQHYSWKSIAERVLELYREVAGK
jgi:alpha-maltose-1-phosphate synthase